MRWTLVAAALACAVAPTLSTRPLVAQDLRVSQVEIAYRERKSLRYSRSMSG
jgi:hypothetical protein